MSTIKTVSVEVDALEKKVTQAQTEAQQLAAKAGDDERYERTDQAAMNNAAAERKSQEAEGYQRDLDSKRGQLQDLQARAEALRADIAAKQKELEGVTGENEGASFF